jgi:hypothetical protein
MVVYVVLVLGALEAAWWVHRSPVVRALLRGRGTDPGQWGSWVDHLYDDGLGPSWRDDGSGGERETRVRSRHTRRR